MSKYDNFNYNEGNNPILPGEKVIWEGKPKKSAFIINKVIIMAPFAILWLMFDSIFIGAFIGSGAMEEAPAGVFLFLIPFFLFHLMPVWIWLANILTANRKWKNTKYYITDKRIIIQNGFIAENYQTIYYKDIKNVRLHIGIIDKMLGVGDVYFDTGYTGAGTATRVMGTAFLDIENYQEIYQKAQKVVLDIQTDIEYPNALRPESNPGYNTEYNPIDRK